MGGAALPLNWAGRTVAILAGGPSLDQRQADAVRASAHQAVVVNNSYRLLPEAALLYAADARWWHKHPQAHEFAGVKVCAQPHVKGVHFVSPRLIGRGGSSALRAAHLAAELGARRIVLLGVDLDPARLTHWHGLHKGLQNPTPAIFDAARAAWSRYADEAGRPEIINCSPGSTVTCFPAMPLQEALCLH